MFVVLHFSHPRDETLALEGKKMVSFTITVA